MARLNLRQKKDLSAQIADITGRLNKITLSDYPVWLMDQMMGDIEAQRHRLLKQLKNLDGQVADHLAAGNI
ncbi:MAG: hypothetical protein AAFY17_03395, partial [Cyanobacteria bacterium J06642_11]